MKIARNESAEAALFASIRDKWDGQREGIHLTDLLYPRQKYWQVNDPKEPTDEQIMYWLTGKGHENVLLNQGVYTPGRPAETDGIIYSVDAEADEIPVEVKTRRAYLARDDDEALTRYDSYLLQLKSYLALRGQITGRLLVWCLAQKQDDGYRTRPELRIYDVEITPEEGKEWKAELVARRTALENALESGDWSNLPLCPDWMCATTVKIMTRRPRCSTCGKEWKTERGGKNHAAKFPEHKVEHAQYRFDKDPNCAWLAKCQPEGEKK